MNRRFLSLLLILIAGLTLWFTSRWWLPWVLDQLPRIEANADLIQAIEALVNIVWLFFTIVVGYLLWLSRPRATSAADRDLQDAMLTPVTIFSLLNTLGQGANLNWIDRGAVRPADLRLYGRVVIAGRSGLGKTREAIELIHRAVDNDLVLADRIFRPGPALRFVAPEAIASQLARSFDPHLPALLFVDDLPYHFTGEGLEHLSQLIDALAEGKTLYVVATARSDQLTPEHDAWLEQQRFHPHPLPDLAADGIARLVDSAAGLFSLQVPGDARDAFAAHSDGTPQHPLIALRLLRQQGHQRISADDARIALSDSAVQAWAETRRYITDPQRAPAAAYVLDALAHFHVAHLTAYRSLVIPYAAHLARAMNAPRRQCRRRTLERALAYLDRFEIRTVNRIKHWRLLAPPEWRLLYKFEIRTVDRIILYRDEIAALAPPADLVLEQLTTFLARHGRFIHHSWFRLWSISADTHREAVSDLARSFQAEHNQIQATDLYNLALAISPHSSYYYARGISSYRTGNLAEALAAFQQAIALDPKQTFPYKGLGSTYCQLGDYAKALAAYQQAIGLNPKDARPHHGLGDVYFCMGRHEEAIIAYFEAIALDPKYVNPYDGLGVVYRSHGRDEEAIAAYQQAIALDPEFVTPRVALAGTYRKLGDDKRYQQGVAAAQSLMTETESHYIRARYASICGDVDEALALLEAAIAKAPGERMLAQYDPDFDFIRDDARFRVLVGD